MRVVEHPFNEKIYGVKLREHGEVVPVSELWSQVGLWRNHLVWLIRWLFLGLVL